MDNDDMHREAFEIWAIRQPWFSRAIGFGMLPTGYIEPIIESRWQGWQAAIHHMREQEESIRNAPQKLCVKCGNPTMHVGNVCYACSHSEQEDKA